ncbi:MAG: polysaccharide lyase beta-sandwich domain-containing protein, partial [Clostridia bacterium]
CQAVWHTGTKQLQAVFYQAGKITVNGFEVAVDRPCAILLRFDDEKYTIWVSNPDHEKADITVTLSGSLENRILFALGEGYMFNNLGRPLGYSSTAGFLPYRGAMGDQDE